MIACPCEQWTIEGAFGTQAGCRPWKFVLQHVETGAAAVSQRQLLAGLEAGSRTWKQNLFPVHMALLH